MDVVRPATVDEALEALAARAPATLLAGGTDLMVDVNLHHARPDTVVALRRVADLRELDGGWIGAGVTYDRLMRADRPALAQLARTVGSPQIRATGTVGGNLGTASPAGDTLPFLAAVDARVVLASVTGTRRLRWDQFLLGPKRTARHPDELILGVELPPAGATSAFAKVGVRQAMVIATVNACAVRDGDGRTRIAVGAVGPTVLRVPAAEALLSDTTDWTDDVLDEATEAVRAAVRPIDDHRASAAYRRHAVGVLVRRVLERCR